jgi:hypothetical protein
MINARIGEIIYSGEDATEITNVNQYIFDYLYANFIYCDSVIAADNYAKTQSTTYSSAAYKNALWSKSKYFTIPLYKRASHALADLIYTAWLQAGSPSLTASVIADPISISNAVLEQNQPNPFLASTYISFTLKENTKVLLQVRDINGTTIATLIDKTLPASNQNCEWVPDTVASGLYYLVLNTGKYIQVKKMVYSGGK